MTSKFETINNLKMEVSAAFLTHLVSDEAPAIGFHLCLGNPEGTSEASTR
jgi:hypothetical protein